MLYNNDNLFSQRDVKSETVTIRLTPQQKNAIYSMANGKSVSAYILSLIALESQQLMSKQLLSVVGCGYNDTDDEDLPF